MLFVDTTTIVSGMIADNCISICPFVADSDGNVNAYFTFV
jgi:hypothetical protein